jgi:hypothetical protein
LILDGMHGTHWVLGDDAITWLKKIEHVAGFAQTLGLHCNVWHACDSTP